MKKTFKNGTAITFNRPSSQNHGLTGTVVAKRDKETSPIGVMLSGKTAIVWTSPKFLTVNDQITDSVTSTNTSISVGDRVNNVGKGAYSGKSGVVKKLRTGYDNNVGVEYRSGMITWTKETNLVVSGGVSASNNGFTVGDLVVGVNEKTKNFGKQGVVRKHREDGRVGVLFNHKDDIVWCKPTSISVVATDSYDSSEAPAEMFASESPSNVVINFHGINITVSKDCNVVVTPTGISVN